MFFDQIKDIDGNIKDLRDHLKNIGVAVDGKRAIVWAAIDNLIKGGAGQAVQCLNLMYGWDETTGLFQAPALP